MTPVVLGLDIGGANLKAATADKRARSVPFPLWKQPDRLPAALAALVAEFPDATELAVTMTGELCDCYQTKREGVNAILDAVQHASGGRAIRVWSTDGGFVTVEEARADHMKVAASNWHALATYAAERFAPTHGAMLIDIGSTTSDLGPIYHGVPSSHGNNDLWRLEFGELVYVGVRRTPLFAIINSGTMAELFATTADLFVVLGMAPEAPNDTDTADNRPLTIDCSYARIARILGGDVEILDRGNIEFFARKVHKRLLDLLCDSARKAYFDWADELRTIIVSGSGEFLAQQVVEQMKATIAFDKVVSLNDHLGPAVSACAPAYALAVLGTERRP
jgi:(4-(4-[2-(gamma-L-glutamylamino)ethyl]phenoxymethyl)furan-2-yl)methanamine synthase